MKITLTAAALLSGALLLPATEKVPFSYGVSGAKETVWSDKGVVPGKPVRFSPNETNQYGPLLAVNPSNPDPDTMYRVRVDLKGAKSFHYRDGVRSPRKWTNEFRPGRGVMTFYIMSNAQKKAVAAMVFPKNSGTIEIRALSVEKITPGEYTANLLCNDALEPGFWYGHWGARDNCFPVLKKDSDSPLGSILSFPASAEGDGHKTTLPLPFLPDRKYELSFWIRSDTPTTISCQVAYGNIGFTAIAVKKEWTQVKLSARTPAEMPEGSMWLMFLNLKNQVLPAFDLGGVDFHYLNPES